MIIDPHEQNERCGSWRKNEELDKYLEQLNQVISQARLSGPKLGNHSPDDLPLIYVVSAPRSGGTLLSQILCKHLDVGYIDNIAARFWLTPSAGIALSQSIRHFSEFDSISFESFYGRTKDPLEPNEFGYFWRHWLNLDTSLNHKLNIKHLTTINIKALTQTLRNEILATYGKAVVLKNPICGLQANFLTKAHPKSLFIHITRDPRDSAVSILNARKAHYGNYQSWWSLKPSTYPEILNTDSPADEVFDQVLQCRKDIETELKKESVHSITLTYRELCESPSNVLNNIVEKILEFGYSCKKLNFSNLQPLNFISETKSTPEFDIILKKRMIEFKMA